MTSLCSLSHAISNAIFRFWMVIGGRLRVANSLSHHITGTLYRIESWPSDCPILPADIITYQHYRLDELYVTARCTPLNGIKANCTLKRLLDRIPTLHNTCLSVRFKDRGVSDHVTYLLTQTRQTSPVVMACFLDIRGGKVGSPCFAPHESTSRISG